MMCHVHGITAGGPSTLSEYTLLFSDNTTPMTPPCTTLLVLHVLRPLTNIAEIGWALLCAYHILDVARITRRQFSSWCQ